MKCCIYEGLGFPASLLSDKQEAALLNELNPINGQSDVGFYMSPFLEDYVDKENATIVIKPYGRRKGAIKKLNEISPSKGMALTSSEMSYVVDLFDKLKISSLVKEIKPIIFLSEDY